MLRYVQISGSVFAAVAVIQLLRIIQGWPVQIGTTAVPVAFSIVACLVAGSLAIWAFRLARGAA